ncbi:MAG: hypothetical protein F4X65_00255 [Chloroflexi bacterium]|nr:hypothetical protein [Chloroflexota bacterium]
MTTFTITDLENQVDHLSTQISQLQRQQDALRITAQLLRVGAVETVAAATLDQPLQDLPPPSPPAQDDLPPNNLPIHNPEDLDLDFTGTRNLLDRLRVIGRAAEGHYLSLGVIAHYLQKARPNRKGSRRSLKTYIRTCISKHPEHFERVSFGTYRYHDTPRPRSVWQTDGYDHSADPEH